LKVLVIYYSESGQTEKIANVIFNAVKEEHEAELKKLLRVDVNNLNSYDLVFIGTPCHDSDLAKPTIEFLSKLPDNPRFKLAGFYTHACMPPEASEEYNALFERWVGKCQPTFERITNVKEIDLLGIFRCMGAAVPPIEQFIHSEIVTDEKLWKEVLPIIRASPNAEDIENARKFALKIIKHMKENQI
jgi:flavodoxin